MLDTPRHLLLVRHGESTWNAEGRWQGQADPPLSPAGAQQARAAAARLAGAGLTSAVASDLRRARETAEIVAAALGLGTVRLERGLREIDVGNWCGLTRPQIEEGWPGQLQAWREGRLACPPGGETRASLTERALATVVRLVATPELGERPLVVTHGGVVRAIVRHLGHDPGPVENLSGRWIDVGPDGTLVPGEPFDLAGEQAPTVP